MIGFVLDTDTLTLFGHQHPKVVAQVAAHAAEVAVTTLTIEEQFGGWFGQLHRAKTAVEQARISRRIATTAGLLATFEILAAEEPAIARADALFKLKLNVGRTDLRIAAVALEVNATVVTRNRQDFGRVPGLTIVDWSV